ncbi:Uricase [Ananas comosus]|uniref:Uricase n=1 Tax=Ananas comosus TaxID=4615 RepID=A0A199VYS2_ANACO|nr:Uricase [Ananas comosus]
MAEGFKLDQKHGKSRVRVSRVWRQPLSGGDAIVEWNVSVSLFSDCLPAYTSGDNSAIVATDSMKNTVYAKAKECSEVVSVEVFAIILARHFSSFYPQVSAAEVKIVEKPWERMVVSGRPHSHGDYFLLLQSGFEEFVRDKYTLLPETRERMMATEVTTSWRYTYDHVSQIPPDPFCFTERYKDVKKVLEETFFGPQDTGVYSPSVQNTLFQDIASIHLRMPNLHFLPVNLSSKENPTMVKFDNDVYVPTDEPHGTIEATLSRTMSKM